MSNNKKEGTGKKVIGGIALGLVLILLGGVAGGLLQHHYKWGEDEPTVEEPEDPKDEASSGGTVIGESTGNGVKLMSAKIAKEDYAANGISPMADTAYTITATVAPSNATNKALDWSVAFKNPSSEWATGKTVTDYVTITPTTDGAVTATVECKQAFGEPVVVTATSRANPDISATATCDYVKRAESLSATFSASELKWQTEYKFTQMKVRDNFNNAFTLAAGEYQDTQATFTLEYSCTYEEEVYHSGETSINLKFDAESLVITVTDITLDNDHFIFLKK